MNNIKFRYLISLLTVCLLYSFDAGKIIAQDKNITTSSRINTVMDSYGNPVLGVEVGVKGTDVKVKTLSNGAFVLNFEKGDVLTFKHSDFLYFEEKVNKLDMEKGVKIHLQEIKIKNPETLTGPYGDSISKVSYLGAASTIYTEQLSKSMGTTIIPGMVGRIAGLNIIQTRGARVHYISGNSHADLIGNIPVYGNQIYSDNSEYNLSSRGQTPIVLVDGIQREFYSLDPEAIESVSLVKDALSSMFLGMQSSRGALIITTKKPIKSAMQVSFTGKYGINTPINIPKPLDSYQYAYLLNEALVNDGKSPVYSYDDFEKFKNGTSPYTNPNINWYNELLNKSSASQSYNMNVSGGNNIAQYFISLGYNDENGLFITSPQNSYNTNLSYQRYLITSKVNVKVTQDFTTDIMLVGRIEDGIQPGGNGDGYSNLLNTIFTTPNGAYPIMNPNGTWGGNVSFINNLMSQTINSGYIKDNARDILGSAVLNYDFNKIVKGLSIRAFGSITTQSRSATNRSKRSPVYAYKIDTDGNAVYTMYNTPSPQSNSFNSVENYQDMYGQIAVNYDRLFGVNHLKASIKGDTRTRLINYDLPEIPSNIMGDFSYSFKDKYFAQAAVTESYYNRYAPNKRWGTFYACGLGWDLAKEDFMKSIEWLNQLKIRGIFGLTGNGITNSGYYIWNQTFSYNGAAWYPLGTSQSSGFITSENQPLANPNITWEKANKTNIGLDIAMLNNKILFTADLYDDYYFDLLQSRGKSIELIGSTYPLENIGKAKRYGAELSFTYQDHAGKVNYYITGNWSIEQSKVLFMDEQKQPYDYLYQTGKPIGAIFGLVAKGFLSSDDIAKGYPVIQGFNNIQPGDVKYLDKNGDGVIDEFDRTVIGGDKPLCYFGIDLGLEFYGFEISALMQGVYNRDIYISDRNFTEGFMQINQNYGQAYEHLLNRWTPETANTATFPRLSAGGNNYNYGNGWGTSLWLKSGNFLRLKNFSLAYNLPESFTRKYLGSLRLKFFAEGQNLFTMSATDLVDPEVGFTNYPIQKNINFGVNIKF
jgi:TonB-linked SusC/RagA family outer membrane protein